MARKQLLVAAGVAAAVITIFLAATFLRPFTVAADPLSRLVFAGKCLLVPGAALLAGIGMTGNRRFFSAQAIDGGRVAQDAGLDINLRYNLNTLEQTVLVLIAWPLLALWLPAPGMLGWVAVLFGIGRAAFWIGYRLAPWARAFGFGLTFYPTVAAFVWLAWSARTH